MPPNWILASGQAELNPRASFTVVSAVGSIVGCPDQTTVAAQLEVIRYRLTGEGVHEYEFPSVADTAAETMCLPAGTLDTFHCTSVRAIVAPASRLPTSRCGFVFCGVDRLERTNVSGLAVTVT